MKKPSINPIPLALWTLLSVIAAIGLRAWLYPVLTWHALELQPEPNTRLQGYKLTIVRDHPIYFDQGLGKWYLIYFGYTGCQRGCRQTLNDLDTLVKKFDGVDSQFKPSGVFTSLDPVEDNEQTLPSFIDKNYPGLSGISGHYDELEKLASLFGLPFHHTTIEADKQWLEQHPSRIYVIDPQLRYIGSFAAATPAETMYDDMQQLTHQLWRYHHNR
jgi:cytochrome oxidase Cu insertion factor (SCO1/SenC/PrrC family)